MLFNSVCALAARTLSDYLDPPEHEAAIPKYTASFLAQVFFNRARYHAILSDLGPNLATCQSLLLMTLREVRHSLSGVRASSDKRHRTAAVDRRKAFSTAAWRVEWYSSPLCFLIDYTKPAQAFDLGLHRKREEGDPEMSTEEAATRVRAYWACYIVGAPPTCF